VTRQCSLLGRRGGGEWRRRLEGLLTHLSGVFDLGWGGDDSEGGERAHQGGRVEALDQGGILARQQLQRLLIQAL
jgi:hypothetical protein